MTEPVWRIRLSGPAQADIHEIYRWTVGRFGVAQADAYLSIIDTALGSLRSGPEIAGVRPRSDIAPGLYTYHVGRPRGRHLILFRISEDAGHRIIAVGRILHEAMDLVRHVLPEDGGDTGNERL